MGTNVTIEIVIAAKKKEVKIRKLLKEAELIFRGNEKIFSRFDPKSELSKINKNLFQKQEVSKKMSKVLELCLEYYNSSKGYFDPRVIETIEATGYCYDFRKMPKEIKSRVDFKKIGDTKNILTSDLILNQKKRSVILKKRVDLAGIVKSFTVIEVRDFLCHFDEKNFLINAGGDIYASGFNKECKKWRISVEGISEKNLILELSDCGVATSGINRRHWIKGNKKFHHLVNPFSPKEFLFDLNTVTVVSSDTQEADIWAKTLFLMGSEKGKRFAELNKIKAIFLDNNNNAYLSKEIEKNIL